jgi:hypothetical protein
MPTRGRHGWAADAVRMWREQTYTRKELVVIDDLADPSFIHGLTGPGIQYHRAPRHTIGEKRNLAVSRSAGEIIAHWDSDDKYHRWRLADQVELLLRTSRVDLVGYNSMTFEDADTGALWEYTGSRPIGVSFVYWRDAWEKQHFLPVNTGEDVDFADRLCCHACAARDMIVARIHHGNTSEKREPIAMNPAQWRRLG